MTPFIESISDLFSVIIRPSEDEVPSLLLSSRSLKLLDFAGNFSFFSVAIFFILVYLTWSRFHQKKKKHK